MYIYTATMGSASSTPSDIARIFSTTSHPPRVGIRATMKMASRGAVAKFSTAVSTSEPAEHTLTAHPIFVSSILSTMRCPACVCV